MRTPFVCTLLALGACSADIAIPDEPVAAATRASSDNETPEDTADRLGLDIVRHRGWSPWWGPGTWRDALVKVPEGSGSHPVALYTAGTYGAVNSVASLAALDALAEAGFVAAAVDYSNGLRLSCDAFANKAEFLYADDRDDSALNVVCALPGADCDLGVVTMGHSQGGAMAALAADHSDRVLAAVGTGVGVVNAVIFDHTDCALPVDRGGSRLLPDEAILAMTGESDVLNGWGSEPEQMVRDQLVLATGLDGSECEDDRCFRANGSGWIRVPDAEVDDGEAQHSFMSVGEEQPLPPSLSEIAAGIDPVRAHLQADWLDDAPGIDWSLPDGVAFLAQACAD